MNELNKIIKEELKQIPLIIGIKGLTKEKKKIILGLLKENNIVYKITILTKENPLKIIKASLTEKDRNLINKIKEVLKWLITLFKKKRQKREVFSVYLSRYKLKQIYI